MHTLIQAAFYRKFARARVQEKQHDEMPLSQLKVCLGHQTTPERTTDFFFPLWMKPGAQKGNLKSKSVYSMVA